MELSLSSEATSWSSSHEFSSILWFPKVYYHVHMSLTLIDILMQKNPDDTFPFYFFKTHFNIILPFMPRAQVFHKNSAPTSLLSRAYYIPHPSHLPLINHPNCIWQGVQIKKLVKHFSPASWNFLPRVQIFFSNTLSPCSFISVRN
jgi:hypothetical protein